MKKNITLRNIFLPDTLFFKKFYTLNNKDSNT